MVVTTKNKQARSPDSPNDAQPSTKAAVASLPNTPAPLAPPHHLSNQNEQVDEPVSALASFKNKEASNVNAQIGQGLIVECNLLTMQGKVSAEGVNGCTAISVLCVKNHLCDHQDSSHLSFCAIERIIDVDCVPCLNKVCDNPSNYTQLDPINVHEALPSDWDQSNHAFCGCVTSNVFDDAMMDQMLDTLLLAKPSSRAVFCSKATSLPSLLARKATNSVANSLICMIPAATRRAKWLIATVTTVSNPWC